MDVVKLVKGQWDRVLAWVAVLVGGIFLLVGWFGVSRSSLPSEQLPYLVSGGLGGLIFVALGATLWLSADLSDEWRMLDDIHEELKDIRLSSAPTIKSNGSAPQPLEVAIDAPARTSLQG